jgi:hypothetical protein
MKKTMTKIMIKKIGISFGLLLCTSMAHAYLLPANFVLNKMVKDRAVLKNIEFEGKITDLKSNSNFREITKIDFLAGKIHSQFLGDSNEVLGEIEGKISALHPLGIAWFGIGMCSNGVKVKEFLEQVGVTIAETAEAKLKRIRGRPIWEIGETASLIVEKDQFVLGGFEQNHQNGFEVEEISTVGLVNAGVSTRLPKLIRFHKDAVDRFIYELKVAKVNQKNMSLKGAPLVSPQAHVQEWIELVH